MPALLRRLLLGALIATVMVVLIDRQLGRVDGSEVDGSEVDRPPRHLDTTEPPPLSLPPTIPSGCAWLIYICAPGLGAEPDAIPPAIRPLAAIGADGRISLLRPAPAPENPGRSDWIAAGIVVPERRLAALSPQAGAALLELLHAWRGGWRVSLGDRIVTLGDIDQGGLAALLRHAR